MKNCQHHNSVTFDYVKNTIFVIDYTALDNAWGGIVKYIFFYWSEQAHSFISFLFTQVLFLIKRRTVGDSIADTKSARCTTSSSKVF